MKNHGLLFHRKKLSIAARIVWAIVLPNMCLNISRNMESQLKVYIPIIKIFLNNRQESAEDNNLMSLAIE